MAHTTEVICRGRIEVLQEFLGETPTPEKFEELSRIELSAIFDVLQARFENRKE